MLDSVTDLASLLKVPSLLVTKAYVAGEWVAADDGTTFPVTNPARGDVICHLPNLGRAEAARAITAAHKPASTAASGVWVMPRCAIADQ